MVAINAIIGFFFDQGKEEKTYTMSTDQPEVYLTVKVRKKQYQWSRELTVMDIPEGRNLIQEIFMLRPKVQMGVIEMHQRLKKGKIFSSIVITRETWIKDIMNPKLETAVHLANMTCPKHNIPYKHQVDNHGFEVTYGICDECLKEEEEEQP